MSDFIFDLLYKDLDNVKMMNETLWEIKRTVFDSLYRTQYSLTGIQRFDMKMSDSLKVNRFKYTFNINTDLIDTKNRLKFKKSKYFNTEIPGDVFIENPSLFTSTPLCFIEGELYTNVKYKCEKDKTILSFKLYESINESYLNNKDGMLLEDFTKFIENDAKITVLIVPSFPEYIREGTNIHTVKNYTTQLDTLGMPIGSNFIKRNKIMVEDPAMGFITVDDNRMFKYRMLNCDISDNKLYFNENQINTLTNSKINIRLLYLNNLLTSIKINPSEEYFSLDIQDMPIPKENILVFRKNNENYYFDHETTLDLFYPNIYKINCNHKDELLILVYYSDDTVSIGTKHDNELALYYRFMGDIAAKYKNKTISSIISNYKPIKIEYSINDLEISPQYPDNLQYKTDKLIEMVMKNVDYYGIYLNKLIGYESTFYVDMDRMQLADRIRVNNRTEIKDPDLQTDFTEPCYLFIFRHDSNNDKINIFVDNYHFYPKYYYTDDKYKYVYIPMGIVTPKSIIEVQKLGDNTLRKKINVVYDEYIPFTINNKRISVFDLFFTYIDNDGTEKYMDEKEFSFYVDYDGEKYLIDKTEFYGYRNIFIKFNSSNFIGKTVYINARKINFMMKSKSNKILFDTFCQPDPSNFLFYKNGRLMPPGAAKVIFNENINGPHTVKLLTAMTETDVLTVSHTQYKYRPVYRSDSIPSNGYIDLSNELDKPINSKWYDIYLNGLKLTERNIDKLSSRIFTLKNLKTLRNLVVYEKNIYTGNPEFGSSISDELLENIPELKETITESLPEITDEIPDIMLDVVLDIVEFLNDMAALIEMINPDINQITEDIIEDYPEIFENENFKDVFMINPDNINRIEDNIMFNVDQTE